jgi:Bifunctional DNA primase/polymerase, N-terminal/AAA domain
VTPQLSRDMAKLYAVRFGLRVVPIRPGSKVPDMLDWPRLATTDPARIDDWWTNGHLGCGVGIATGAGSRTFVLDVDDNGRDKRGKDTLAALIEKYGPLPPTPMVLTPSGGMHLYFDWPGFPLKESLGDWLDIRGEGRQVLAPPSVHPNGGTYVWEESSRLSHLAIAKAPEWMLDLLRLDPLPTAGGDDRTAPFNKVFEAAGWPCDGVDRHGHTYWCRPDKDPREGTSATVYADPPARAVIYTTTGVRPEDVNKQLHSPREVATALGMDEAGLSDALGVVLDEPVGDSGDDESVKPGPQLATITLADLLDADEPEHDWHVPGRFEKGDRLMVTGPEGQGKSTLLRQLGIAAAIGEDSLAEIFPHVTHEPLRVLLVDAENSERQLRREFAKQIGGLGLAERALVRRNLRVALCTGGLELNDPHDRTGDRARLDNTLLAFKPDLLIIGPVWKLIEGDSTSEEVNRPLARWLDKMRVAHHVTLLIEAHTPHDAARPYGWSGWKRWPEFGIHLHQDGRLEHWRGQREERAWPDKLERSTGQWLWKPASGTAAPSQDRTEDQIDDARLAVHRVLRMAKEKGVPPLTKDEIIERSAKRDKEVRAAVARMVDDGSVEEAGKVERERSNRRPYPVMTYRLPGESNVPPDSGPPREGNDGREIDPPSEPGADQQELDLNVPPNVPPEEDVETGGGSDIDDLDDTLRCPRCDEPLDPFEEIIGGICRSCVTAKDIV